MLKEGSALPGFSPWYYKGQNEQNKTNFKSPLDMLCPDSPATGLV